MNVQMVLAGFGPLLDPIVNGFEINESWVVLLQTMPHLMYFPMSFVVTAMYKNM